MEIQPIKTEVEYDAASAPETAGRQLAPVIASLQHHLGANLIAVVLFGSRARGDHHRDSDWDLLVIAERLSKKTFQRHLHLKQILPPLWRGRVAILAKTPAEFETGIPSLFLDVALDGIILYDTDDYVSGRLTQLRRLISTAGLYREQRGRDLVWQWQVFPGIGHQLTWEGVI
ncbi:MAG: nucleotidyltransferase domain-containing protein [Caldilineaceae bacterium]